jgi:aminoglycoside 6'-N-acetyltransferase I
VIQIRPIQHIQAEFEAVAHILVEGFADRSPAWPTLATGISEVISYSTDIQISLVAIIDGTIVGWISATPQYQQFGWELHPLVVAPSQQKRGVGTALVENLCVALHERGGTVLYAWSDDECLSTSLGGKDLMPDPLHHLSQFCASSQHAGGFYLKLQFALCGVLPDANGYGKPDVLFARRIR